MKGQDYSTPSLSEQLDQAWAAIGGGLLIAMTMAAFSLFGLTYEDPNPQPKHEIWNDIAWLIPVPFLLLSLAVAVGGWLHKRRIEAALASRPPRAQSQSQTGGCCHHHTCCHRH